MLGKMQCSSNVYFYEQVRYECTAHACMQSDACFYTLGVCQESLAGSHRFAVQKMDLY